MKNVLFKTHVFSIEEHDGISNTSFERSFTQALEKMIQNNGMYIVANRQYEYGLVQRKLVIAPEAKTIVFGKAYTYEKAIKSLRGDWLEYVYAKHAEDGFNLFVTNFKLNRIIAVAEDAIVLPEITLERFLKRMKSPQPDKKIIFTDYTFELGNGIEFSGVLYNECLQQQIKKLLGCEKIDFIKVNTVNFYEDGAIGMDKSLPHYLFSEDVLMAREFAMRYFEKNKRIMNFLRLYVDDVYVFCEDNNSLQRIPEKASFVPDKTLKKWAKG